MDSVPIQRSLDMPLTIWAGDETGVYETYRPCRCCMGLKIPALNTGKGYICFECGANHQNSVAAGMARYSVKNSELYRYLLAQMKSAKRASDADKGRYLFSKPISFDELYLALQDCNRKVPLFSGRDFLMETLKRIQLDNPGILDSTDDKFHI